ncbi:hypothetical protein NST74_05035 [Paenibacillus sp. FSL F4-0125]|uniref:hypothetical protein n=1 Tax=Paenibacillus sp. FSL F4-0125 TaxID=2954730 RepID=UPI0030FB3D02
MNILIFLLRYRYRCYVPAYTLHHSIRDSIDMDKVRDLLFTHSHSDHLYPEDLLIRALGYAQFNEEEELHLYGHDYRRLNYPILIM